MSIIPALSGRRASQLETLRVDLCARFAGLLAALRGHSSRGESVRSLGVEPLEPRANPAVVTVNTTDDAADSNLSDGVAQTASGDISLRAAIMQASFSGGSQTIHLPAGVYQLTQAGSGADEVLGDLDVWDPQGGSSPNLNLVIEGDPNGPAIIDAGGIDRAFQILGFNGSVTVTFRHVTITGGRTDGSAESEGGGLYISGADVTIEHSTIYGNSTASTSGAVGGAIYFYEGSGGSLTIVNSTITDSSAWDGGGGIYADVESNSVTLNHVTVAYTGAGSGAGIQVSGMGSVLLLNSIVYGNYIFEGPNSDVAGAFSSSSQGNVLGAAANASGLSAATNLFDTDPLLGSFDYHDGLTKSYELLSDSPAIDYATGSSTTEDQRHHTRPYDGDGNGLSYADAGAYEYDGPNVPTQTVSGTVSGYIWFDTNGNGFRDQGEGVAKNIKVRLYWGNGDLICETTTDENGYYKLPISGAKVPTDSEYVYVVALAPFGFAWTLQDQDPNDILDSDLNSQGVSHAMKFPIDEIVSSISGFAITFPEPDDYTTPQESWYVDGGLVRVPVEETPIDPVFTPPGPGEPNPYDFFYKVPAPAQLRLQDPVLAPPYRIEAMPIYLGDQSEVGKQAYLNVYKITEVGRRKISERIAVMTINGADPNIAQGMLGAAAPGTYRITVQDSLGEELVWEGELPFNFANAQNGVQKAWKQVRDRLDALRDQRDQRDAAPQTPTPARTDKPEGATDKTSQGAWSEQVERLATLLTGLDLPRAVGATHAVGR